MSGEVVPNPPEPPFVVSQRFFASLIGVVALGLPAVLLAVSVARGCFHDSLSHHYFTRITGDAFVIALAMIGLFLFAYRGRDARENLLAGIAGVAAIGIAAFPTNGAGHLDPICVGRGFFDPADGAAEITDAGTNGPSFVLFEGVDVVHFGSAAVLFGFLAWYALFNFTRIHDPRSLGPDGRPTVTKRRRNRIYRAAGATIIACMVALGGYTAFGSAPTGGEARWMFWNGYNVTFWLEAVALVAFGIAWIVRGRAFDRMLLDEDV